MKPEIKIREVKAWRLYRSIATSDEDQLLMLLNKYLLSDDERLRVIDLIGKNDREVMSALKTVFGIREGVITKDDDPVSDIEFHYGKRTKRKKRRGGK